jgi:predicted ATPase
MLSYLSLKNFKCFEEQNFTLGNLTLVAGANGAGKSTLIQALMLLRQSALDKRTLLSEKIQLRGSLVDLRSADAIRYFESEDTDITISIEDDTITDALDVIIKDAVRDEETCKTDVSDNLTDFEERCSLFSQDLVYLAPDRVSPAEQHLSNFSIDPTDSRIGDKYGRMAASRLYRALSEDEKVQIPELNKSGDMRVISNVSAWMSYIMDFNQTVKVTEQDKEQIKMTYSVKANGIDTEVSPYNMPFGNSSVFPIVVALMTAPKDSLIVIENPEAHIHPKAQTKMGELLSVAAENGVQIIIETHSDHLLNGIRIAVKKQQIDENNVEVHFVYADQENPLFHRTKHMQIHDDGSMESWPVGFFDEWEESLKALTKEE